ncbi:MAG: transcriptional regulator [Solirubrobacterales bacterium]|nr:transcriptional regulator [Solirubrobacterales bacterium]
MLGREYDQTCSIARTLEVLGERWTLLVIRDVFNGRRRFDQLQESLGIARNVLSTRLGWLVDEGILEKRPYQERPARYEYFLTEKGLDLWPVMVSLLHWGDRHLAGADGPPMVIVHKGCGGEVDDRRICRRCGKPLEVRDARAEYGPGAPPETRRRAEPART